MENGPNDASTSARYGDVERRLLRTLISSVSTSNDFRTALQTTLRAVCEETGWDYGEAWIPSVAGDVLECSQQCHAPAPELASYRESSRHVVFPPDVGLPGRVWTSKEPEWIPDVSALPKTRFLRVDIAREVGLKAAVGVPIVADKQVLAVLAFFMFESRDEDGWALEMVSVAATELGALLRRVQAEERNRWHQNTQAMINALLHLSLETLTLTETLDRALRLIVSLPWLKIESRGSVSLVEDESDTLTLAAQCGLAQELCELCRSVPFGTCHCGRAAASGQTVFTGHLDESHEIHHQGMTPHGHYCVPIMFDGHVRGVLNTYVEEGHTHEKAEQAALEAAADVLASVIERKRTVEALAVNRASFLSAMRTAGDTLVIVDQKGVITALDPSELSPEQPDQDGIQRNHHPALPGTVADAGPATEILESVAAGYRVIRMLGSGTTGFVFLVEKDNRQFAMKVLREHGDRRESVARMKRFFREAEILSNIEHPAVVRIHQLGFSTKGKQAPYLLMEYVSGHPLTRYIAGDNLTLAQKLSVIGQITDALVAVHGQHILHRDIKPANILIGPDQRIKITDFGIARLHDSALTATHDVMGTPAYMAPESFQSGPVDHRADLFSVGAVSYELITGEKPFRGASPMAIGYNVCNSAVRDPADLVPSLPPQVQSLLLRSLHKEPDARFASAAEFSGAIAAIPDDIIASFPDETR